MFSGPYLITNVTHSISEDGFNTSIEGTRQPFYAFPKIDNFIQTLSSTILKTIQEKIQQKDREYQSSSENIIKQKSIIIDNVTDATEDLTPSQDCFEKLVGTYRSYKPADNPSLKFVSFIETKKIIYERLRVLLPGQQDFERNNFANEDVFKEFIPSVYTPQPLDSTGEYHPNSVRTNPNTGEEELVYSLLSFKEMKGVTRTSRRLLALNDVFNSFQLDNDFIKIPKVVTNKDGIKVNMATGLEVTKKDYALMKEKGSQDLYDNYYYKKVYTNQVDEFNNLIPLRTYNEKIDG
jgi:hypothetical protein